MKSINITKILGSLVIMAGASTPVSQAATIIDSFETTQNISFNNASGLNAIFSPIAAPDAVGGQRDVGFSQIQQGTIGFPSSTTVNRANFNGVNPGMLTWTNSLNWRSEISMVWDGDDNNIPNIINPNGLTLDLSSDDAFILSSDFINVAGVEATLNVYSGTNESSLSITDLGLVADGNNTDLIFEFANFTTSAGDGVDFATDNIGAIELILTGNENNIEARFGELATRSSSGNSVPEPGISFLVLSGVTLLGGLTSKKKS